MNLQKVISSKKPIESILNSLLSIKAALGKSCQKLCIFVTSKLLQKVVLAKAKANFSRNYKLMAVDNSPVLGVYLDEHEYAAPIFSKLSDCNYAMLTPRNITIPIFNDENALQFIVQVTQEAQLKSIEPVK
jgi:hypothetical protein